MTKPLCTASLAAFLRRCPASPRHWVAFSGGLDSAALLHLCHALRSEQPALAFAAAHVHHGLQTEADAWVSFCAKTCATLDIPFTVRYVEARPGPGESPEAAARAARYAALRALLRPGETLLTAQHQDDQAETVLLQLLRGAGPAGLAAMPEWSPFSPGVLARPLLDYRRRDLVAYAHRHGLRWVDDPSNADPRFSRNYLRHEILPRLVAHWPGAVNNLARTAAHCAEAAGLLGEFARELLLALHDPERNTLRVAALRAHSPARQRLILREWVQASGCATPATAVLARVLTEVLPASADRQPVVRWEAAQIRRFRDELYLLRPFADFPTGVVADWDGIAPLPLAPDNGVLRATLQPGLGLDPELWRRGPVTIRYRHGGEALTLANRSGTRELKKLLQEAAVAPWLRDRVPLIHLGNRLAAVADLWVGAACAGKPDKDNVRLVWEPPQLGFERPRPPAYGPAGMAEPPLDRDLQARFE